MFVLLTLFHLPVYGLVQTPFIRAPEVTLGLLGTTAMDMWSFGCCMIELLGGQQAFYGEDEMEQLTHTIEVNLKAASCFELLIYHVIKFSQYILLIYLIIIIIIIIHTYNIHTDIRFEEKTGETQNVSSITV